ncbi:MAG TPA: long-chain fatty acid--CoA ligase [Acidimicrobiales bacterium]
MTTNLASILTKSADRYADRPAVVLGDQSIDYATLDAYARHFAGALGALGISPGEHVALVLPNVPQFTVAYFGCHYAGTPVVPLNVLLTADELAYHFENSEAVAVVTWESCLGAVGDAMERVGSVRNIIVANADATDLATPTRGHNLTTLVMTSPPVTEAHPTEPDDTAVILYTSGTTGRPKGAELTHANLLANAGVASRLAPLDQTTVALVTLPLFHAFGMTVMQNAVLNVGGSLVLLPRFDAAAALELMARHGVTLFGGVPTMYLSLLDEAKTTPTFVASSLRWCVSGGAPMVADVMAQFEDHFGVCLLEGYGLSEMSPVVSFTVPDRPRTPGTIGYPVPGVEMRLVDDQGAVVTRPGDLGEICVKGPNLMKGYWRNSAATGEAVVDGWFHTGDIGVVDIEGAYRIVDRKKDMVIRAGYNVYPREIEEVLHLHPAVAQAAVVGVPHPRYGEEVKAVVILKQGSVVTVTEIVEWCRERLAAYKYPRIVEVRESLPLGATGKVLKHALKS